MIRIDRETCRKSGPYPGVCPRVFTQEREGADGRWVVDDGSRGSFDVWGRLAFNLLSGYIKG